MNSGVPSNPAMSPSEPMKSAIPKIPSMAPSEAMAATMTMPATTMPATAMTAVGDSRRRGTHQDSQTEDQTQEDSTHGTLSLAAEQPLSMWGFLRPPVAAFFAFPYGARRECDRKNAISLRAARASHWLLNSR
jgi:hypothetical protein